MKLIIQKIWMVIVMLSLSLSASAYDFEVDGFYYNVDLEKKTATLVSGENIKTGEIVIPSTVSYKGRKFTIVAIDGAFKGSSGITSVTIPNSITLLGDESFYGCSGLKNISGIENIKKIGKYCFSGCSSLTELIIPEKVLNLAEGLFENCINLRKVEIKGRPILRLPIRLFYNCKSLETFDIPESVKTIEDSVFSGCEALESIIIPSNVNRIGNEVFKNNISLKDLVIEDSSNPISLGHNGNGHVLGGPGSTFYDCPLHKIYLGRNIKNTSSYTYDCLFGGITTLKEVTIGNSVTTIGEKWFYQCSNLSKIEIPSSVEFIYDFAFAESGINVLVFKDGHQPLIMNNDEIDKMPNTFKGCSNLSYIYIGRNIEFYDDFSASESTSTVFPTSIKEIEIGNYVSDIDCLKKCGRYLKKSLEHYPQLTKLKIGCCVLQIPSLAENKELTELILCSPYPVDATFSNAQYMDLIPVIPEGAMNNYHASETWGKFWSFSELPRLHSDVIYYDGHIYAPIDSDNNVRLLKGGPKKFVGDIVIPEFITVDGVTYTVASVGTSMKCEPQITSVTLPKSVTEIEPKAFYDCKALQNVNLGSMTSCIGNYAFYDCQSLQYANLGPMVLSIGKYGFYNCYLLKAIDLGSKLNSIGEYAFSCCYSFDTLSIPATVTTFGAGAFEKSTIKFLRFEDGDAPLKFSSYSQESEKLGGGGGKYTLYTNLGYFSNTKIDKLYLGRDLEEQPEISMDDIYFTRFYRTDDPFYSTPNLGTVIIGPNVTKIGSKYDIWDLSFGCIENRRCFSGCTSLSRVFSKAENPPTNASFSANTYRWHCLYVPAQSKDLYAAADGWRKFVFIHTLNVEWITMNMEEADMEQGESLQLIATVYPEYIEDVIDETIEWSSSDNTVASVSSSGLVTGLSEGSSIVTATFGGVSTTCKVNVVKESDLESILIDDNAVINVYSIDGMLIGKEMSWGKIKEFPSGIYIIRRGNDVRKIIVK